MKELPLAQSNKSSCQIDAIVSCDERGQLVLPKEVRKNLNLKPGDKLALVRCGDKDSTCCYTLIKTEAIQDMLKQFLGPVMKDMIG